jgi:hypothetical protein
VRTEIVESSSTDGDAAKDSNPLNAELNPICHLLALLGGATIVVVSRLRVNCRDFTVRDTVQPQKVHAAGFSIVLHRAQNC